MKRIFTGIGPAIITPFTNCNKVDYDALSQVIEYVIEGNVDFLVVLGTTGESSTLSEQERQEVLRFVIGQNAGRLPIVAGLGGNCTENLIESVRKTDFTGIDGILSVAPYYNKPTQRGIYTHFSALAEVTPVPVILYNVPSRTGVHIEPETAIELARNYPCIAAMKEASGDLGRISYLLKHRPGHFSVLTGDDNLALPVAALGGDGVISVAANAFPALFSELFAHARAGRLEAARQLYFRIFETIDLLFEEGNPAGVKAALHLKGFIDNNLRLPLVSVSDKLYQELKKRMEENNL